jgi:hypothetical protein
MYLQNVNLHLQNNTASFIYLFNNFSVTWDYISSNDRAISE